jgi:hypothetical protein
LEPRQRAHALRPDIDSMKILRHFPFLIKSGGSITWRRQILAGKGKGMKPTERSW